MPRKVVVLFHWMNIKQFTKDFALGLALVIAKKLENCVRFCVSMCCFWQTPAFVTAQKQ